jgi:hypothetical protein
MVSYFTLQVTGGVLQIPYKFCKMLICMENSSEMQILGCEAFILA